MRTSLVFVGLVIAAGCAEGTNVPVYSVSDHDLATRLDGASPGYLVTALSESTLRIGWSGGASFSGSVRTRGHFINAQAGCYSFGCSEPLGVSAGAVAKTSDGESFSFTGAATDKEEGIELTVDSLPIYLDLAIDGARRPELVSMPGASTPVSADPFGVEPFTPPE